MASEEAADWRVGLTLCQRQQYMLEGQYGSDVTLLVGDGDTQETIQAHRFPLIAGSAVFESLLSARTAYNEKPVVITDVEPAAFKAMLRFLYSDQAELTADNVMSMFYVSKKFSISQLTDLCKEFLENAFTTEKICRILDASIRYKETDLTEKCIAFICKNGAEVLGSGDFLNLSNEALSKILLLDELRVAREVDVLSACMKWAEAECVRRGKETDDGNRRAALGDALFQIRFPTMSSVEFAEVTRRSKLLTASERATVYDHMTLHGDRSSSCDCNMQFNMKQRCSLKEPVIISRFTDRNVRFVFESLGRTCAVDFTCSKTALIAGVGLYGPNKACSYSVDVQLQDNAGQVLAKVDGHQFTSDGSNRVFRLDLPHPVSVTAANRYSVLATFSVVTYYGDRGATDVTERGVTVTFHDSSRGYDISWGSAKDGPVAELHLQI